MKLLNLGCGHRFHRAWVNIDRAPRDPSVLEYDLVEGIPLGDGSADVVYHSHLLEHLSRTDAERLIQESHRVLRAGGITRVAVPDLERLVRHYLDLLGRALSGDSMAERNYDWILLEMYDQAVRHESGGDCAKYLFSAQLANEDFVYERWGAEAMELRRAFLERSAHVTGQPSVWRRLVSKLQRLRPRNELEELGRFRRSGEVHLWMYDRYSLARLLTRGGFRESVVCSAFDSRIPDWASYGLDGSGGVVWKPDSLFMEAIK